MKRTKSARSRRVDPLPGITLNFEIIGGALFVLAGLLAISLLRASAAGFFGSVANETMHSWFGAAAWLGVLALTVIAAIVFLEIHVPKIMVAYSACAGGAFLALAGLFGMVNAGGAVGDAIAHGLSTLFGVTGANIVLIFVVVACIVTPTGISLKRVFGSVGTSVAGAASGLADTTREAMRRSRQARLDAQRERSALTMQTGHGGSTEPTVVSAAVARAPEPATASTLGLAPAPLLEPNQLEPSLKEDTGDEFAAVEAAVESVSVVDAVETTQPLGQPGAATQVDAAAPATPPAPPKQARSAVRSEGGYRLPDFALFN